MTSHKPFYSALGQDFKMMKKINVTGLTARMCAAALFAAVFSVAGSTGALAQKAAAPDAQNTPAPKILVLDRNAIMRESDAGKDITRQVQAYTKAAQKEFKGENERLQQEGQKLQQQVAILSASAKQKKIAAFENEQKAFRAKVQMRQDEIQGGVAQAQQVVEKALGPILQGILAERGANLLMDRSAIMLGTVDIDVTQLAIQRLNKKLPSVKVNLVKPPSGSQG